METSVAHQHNFNPKRVEFIKKFTWRFGEFAWNENRLDVRKKGGLQEVGRKEQVKWQVTRWTHSTTEIQRK